MLFVYYFNIYTCTVRGKIEDNNNIFILLLLHLLQHYAHYAPAPLPVCSAKLSTFRLS